MIDQLQGGARAAPLPADPASVEAMIDQLQGDARAAPLSANPASVVIAWVTFK
jgi:hypothetical protein